MELSMSSWDPETVVKWLRGLDSKLQQYPFEEWKLTGKQLLHLSSQKLERLGVKKLGHQELILETVEQLCALNYDLKTESLGTVVDRLHAVCQTLQEFIRSRRKLKNYDGNAVQMISAEQLTSVVDVISAAKAVICRLNRCFLERLTEYSTSKEIIRVCSELAECVQKDCITLERENSVLRTCKDLCGICDNIVISRPPAVLNQTASLETVYLEPVVPGDSLGIEILSSNSSLHFISGKALESPAALSHQVQIGDEVIQVNNQVVVGWTQLNLLNKIRENPSLVKLVLKKTGVPCTSQMVGDFLSSETSISRKKSGHVRSHSNPFPFSGSIQKQEEIPRSPLTDQSLQSSDQTIAESPEMIPHQEQGIHVEKGFKSGTGLAISSPFLDSDSEPSTPVSPEVPQVDWERRTESCRSIKKPHSSDSTVMSQVTRRNKKKGSATKLSRRRISCCDLGEVDCDGWLWQKKDNPSFMAPKWRKGWFALKKNSLYWYTHPNDEKAEGFIDLSTYNIESAGLHKRKYVFKLCHAKFKTFFFAAENVDDLSKWVAAIVNAISKHAQHSKVVPSKEEDCYSESEVDDTDEEILSTTLIKIRSKSDSSVESQHSGSSGGDIIRNNPPNQKVTSGTANKETVSAKPQSADLPEDDMEKILKELHQGGVTLIGKPKSFTREHYRSSFIKRNKNPVINEKIHKIRTLKSTLKAKEVELQTIEKLLVNVKKETLSKWKEENQDLHREIMEWAKKLGTLKTGSVNPDPKQRLCPNEYSLTQSLYDNTVHAKNPVTVESSQHRHTEKSSDKMDTTPQAVVYNKPKAKKQVTLV